MALATEEIRHRFAIEPLGKLGSFRSQPYLYTCVRCCWIFRINDPPGSIIALDGLGRRLLEPENAKRALTFHGGPCPAFPNNESLVPEPQRTIAFLSSFSKILQILRIHIRKRWGNQRFPKAAA
jgi:hypothetical protein